MTLARILGLLSVTLSVVLLMGVPVSTSVAASQSSEADLSPAGEYTMGGCRITFSTTGSPRIVASAGRICAGVSEVSRNSAGEVVITKTRNAGATSFKLMAQAGDSMNRRGISAGMREGASTIVVRLFDGRTERRIDLRRASDRNRVAGTDVVIGWTSRTPTSGAGRTLAEETGYESLGAYRDKIANSESTVSGGCVIRFDSGSTPRVHANQSHRCTGLASIKIDPKGNLRGDFSEEQRGSVLNLQADPDETLVSRGVLTGVSASTSQFTISMYDARIGRVLNLHEASDYARVAGSTSNMWLSWTKPTHRPGNHNATRLLALNRYGAYMDGSSLPQSTDQHGCRVRITTSGHARDWLKPTSAAECAGVPSAFVDSSGHVALAGGEGPIVGGTVSSPSGGTNLSVRAGLSGGTGQSRYTLYSHHLDREMDLRKATDRSLLAKDYTTLYVGWTHNHSAFN